MTDETDREKAIPIWDHIAELSARLKAWLYAFFISTVLLLVLPGDLSILKNPFQIYHPLITVILLEIRNRLLPPQYTLIGPTVTTPLEIIVVGAAVFGFGISLPVLAYEIYKFVDPAIRPSERQSLFPFVIGFTVLFVAGALFAFFVLIPFVFFFSLPFFTSIGVSTFIDADQFYNLIFFIIVLTGLVFTLPLVFVLLVKLHFMGTAVLRKNRKYVWAFTLIATALASPDGGPLADVALFIPMIILIEGAIWFAKRYEKDEPAVRTSFLGTEPRPAKCVYCGGGIDSGGVFCGLCGKARI
ncbi:MAG TPA: twin-arginine translocase subunit TatC [Candidatus Dormibacteraeota bacterium]|nr:twin-arginine translocase subunit TatC [Candidatus Dormibacteraeota bacterium]